MIELTTGDLLNAEVDAVVNTVNTEGVMGKGIALQVKRAYPANFKAYSAACKRHEVQLGKMFVFDAGGLTSPRYIVNFPTKGHWRSKTRLRDVERGLQDLVKVIETHRIESIAVPPLGCGNGGLDWRDVRPLIVAALDGLPVKVLVYEPVGAPAASAMRVATQRPRMTAGRAAVLGLLSRYLEPGFGASRLEVQKLLYLLQAAGEPLKLKYKRAQYGPYADKVNHVLEDLEGHFITGFGDRTEPSPLRLLPGAQDEADHYVALHADMEGRFAEVLALIDGFETPYGLELLATVHWVVRENASARTDLRAATKLVQEWSQRKKVLFTERHVAVAWNRLLESGWFDRAA